MEERREETETTSDFTSIQSELAVARRQVQDTAFQLSELREQYTRLQLEQEQLQEFHHAKTLRMNVTLLEKEKEIQDIYDRENVPLLLPGETIGQTAFLLETVTNVRRKYAKSAAQVSFYFDQLVELLEDIEAKSVEMTTQQTAFFKLSQAYLSAISRVADLQITESTQASVITELQESIRLTREELEETTLDCRHFAHQLQVLRTENQQLKNGENIETFDEIEELRRENEALKNRLKDKELIARVENLITVQEENQAKSMEIQRLNALIADMERSQRQVHPSYSLSTPSPPPSATCRNCTLQNNLTSDLHRKNTILNEQISALHTEITALLAKNKEISDAMNSSEIAFRAANNEIQQINAYCEELKQNLTEIRKDNASLRGQCETLVTINRELERKLRDLEAEYMKILTADANEKDDLYTKLQILGQKYKIDRENFIETIVKLKSERENYKFELQNHPKVPTKMTDLLENQQQEIARLKNSIKTLETMHTEYKNELRERLIEANKSENTQFQANFLRLKEQLASALSQNVLKERQCVALSSELEEVKQRLENVQEQLVLEEEVNRKSREMQEKQAEVVSELQKNMKVMQEKLENEEKRNVSGNENLVRLTSVLYRCRRVSGEVSQ